MIAMSGERFAFGDDALTLRLADLAATYSPAS